MNLYNIETKPVRSKRRVKPKEALKAAEKYMTAKTFNIKTYSKTLHMIRTALKEKNGWNDH